MLSRELVFIAFAIPLLPSTLTDNYMHMPFLHSSTVGLVITRYPVILVIVPRIPCDTALRFLAAKYPYDLFLYTYRRTVHY